MRKIAYILFALCACVAVAENAQTISIRNLVNFGLNDNGVANDGKGGFTDDAKNLGTINYKDGINKVFSTKFDLIDPAKNNGKSILAFECPQSKTGLREVVIDLSDKSVRGEALSLLHGCTKSPDVRFTKIGKIEITYKDGKKKEIVLNYAVDIMNVFFPKNRDNAKIWSPSKDKSRAYYFSRFKIDNKEIKSIKLSTTDIATWIVAGVTVEKEFPIWTATDKDWVKVDMSKIAIAKDSILDVSKDFDNSPSGTFGKVTISEDGKLAFENKPNVRQKFHGTVWYMQGEVGKTYDETKTNLKKLCEIVKRQGYNLLRFHATDYLCSRNPEKVQLGYDLYDYLIAQAKKNGIYLNLLVGNNDLNAPNFKWDDRFSLKMKMIMGDKQTREYWRAHAKSQLEHINPYTGLAWKDDPTFMAMEYWNEMDLFSVTSRLDKDAVDFTNAEFRKYLREKYRDVKNLNAKGKLKNKKYKSFEEIDFQKEWYTSEWSNLLNKKNAEFGEYCSNVIKNEIGYKGLIYQFNCNRAVNTTYMSAQLADYAAINIYFKHPSKFMTPPSSVGQESSLIAAAVDMRDGISRKITNRPISFTEYNHCHWNPFKHEGGIVFGAYSALQDFDSMVVHSDAIKTAARSNFLQPFGVFNSPVFRANEFITYCLYMRGDAKKSSKNIELFYSKDYIENSDMMMNGVNGEQTKIGLLTGFSLNFHNLPKLEKYAKVKGKNPDLRVSPVGASRVETAQNFSSSGGKIGKDFDLNEFVKKLRENDILPKDNITSPSKGIFQSETGEIVLNSNAQKISVITQKTEAIAFKKGVENLSALRAISSTTPCAVAVASMDGNPISKSSRMVLTYATDNVNRGMKLTENKDCLLVNAKYNDDILILRGKLSAELKLSEGKNYKLYALAMNGERMSEIPTKIKNGVMKIEIDNAKTPTTFFEISAN